MRDKVVQSRQAEGGELGLDGFHRGGWNGLTGSLVDLNNLTGVDDLVGLIRQEICQEKTRR